MPEFECDVCRRRFDNKEKRRQMKFVVVDVCRGCVGRMERVETSECAGHLSGGDKANRPEEEVGRDGVEDRAEGAEGVEAHES